MHDQFGIDFPTSRASIRPAVFSITASTGIMTDWKQWTPCTANADSVVDKMRLQISVNGVSRFNSNLGDQPQTIITHLDGYINNKITIRASGIDFLPCTDDQEIRAGFLLTDISVEGLSIKKYLQQSIKWCCDDGLVQEFPGMLADNGVATFEITSPLYQWLLSHDPESNL